MVKYIDLLLYERKEIIMLGNLDISFIKYKNKIVLSFLIVKVKIEKG